MHEIELSPAYDHGAIVATSERVAWTVDEVFRGRRFDPSGPIVPASWLGTETLPFLDDSERRVLNHCRAFSYVHLLGNFEEFAPPHLGGIVAADWHDDRARLRSLLRFGDDELKHQQLFRRAELVLEESCGHAFGRWFDDDKVRVSALTRAILAHPPLARSLMVLALEWGTQRHYVESIRDRAAVGRDALYADVLKAHWVEEAQHTKCGTLEIVRIARELRADERRIAFDHIGALGALVDEAFSGQASEEIDTFQAVTGRELGGREIVILHDALSRSLRDIMAGIGLSHPAFASVALAVSPEGAATLGIV